MAHQLGDQALIQILRIWTGTGREHLGPRKLTDLVTANLIMLSNSGKKSI